MYGRIKMMTALCPAWARTYQPVRLVSALVSPGPLLSGCQSRNNNFPCYMLPYHHEIEREFFKRHVDGSDLTGL